nr:MAG TPA: hypothetical protein [Caudoviricetes sp.]
MLSLTIADLFVFLHSKDFLLSKNQIPIFSIHLH